MSVESSHSSWRKQGLLNAAVSNTPSTSTASAKKMISEASYIEIMKNCSKWNERTSHERKMRFRYPYYDLQTGTPQRLNPTHMRTKEQRCSSNDPNIVVQYSSPRWRRRPQPPTDALEVKMFLRDNPVLEAAVNNNTHHHAPSNTPLAEMLAFESPDVYLSKGAKTIYDDFQDLEDDLPLADAVSDEDDWGTKKKGKGKVTKKKKVSKPKAGRNM